MATLNDLYDAASRMCDAVNAHRDFLKSLGIDAEDCELESARGELREAMNAIRAERKNSAGVIDSPQLRALIGDAPVDRLLESEVATLAGDNDAKT